MGYSENCFRTARGLAREGEPAMVLVRFEFCLLSAWLICQVIKLKWTNHDESGNDLVGRSRRLSKMKLLIHVRLFTCKYSCYELESRNSEENISTKSWKKTARFIKVFPANKLYFQIPLLKLCHALKRWRSARVIYYYITTEFHYAKRDSAYGCYVWVKTLKNVLDQFSPSFSRNFDICVLKIIDLMLTPPYSERGESRFA